MVEIDENDEILFFWQQKMKTRFCLINIKRLLKLKAESQEGQKISTEQMGKV
jgi:hypothetical protein